MDIKHLTNDEILSLKTSKLGFPTRLSNSLRAYKIETVKDLIAYSREELLGMRSIGQSGVAVIEDFLKEAGLSLKGAENKIDPNKKLSREEVLSMKIDDTGLHGKIINALKDNGQINDVKQLASHSKEDISKIKHIGKIAVSDIEGFLAKHDLEFRKEGHDMNTDMPDTEMTASKIIPAKENIKGHEPE